MKSGARRLLLLSLDGLDTSKLALLHKQLEKSGASFNMDNVLPLDSAPLTSAHAIWAEILTGTPWHENGCVSLARPDKSLSSLTINTEDDLQKPIRFGSEDALTLFINVPLIANPHRQRVILSDGSNASFVHVSPSKLAEEEPFKSYKPRPYAGLAKALTNTSGAVSECLKLERDRINCARRLLETTDWQACLWRFSAFDQLGHLIGPNFLSQRGLTVEPQIAEFIKVFDELLAQLLKIPNCTVALVSAFSIMECRGQANLNRLLASGGHFGSKREVESPESKRALLRAAATRAISEADTGVPVEPTRRVPSSAVLKTSQLTAASPLAGCIYINAQSEFEDGIVADDQVAELHRSLINFLSTKIVARYGEDMQIVSRPAASAKNSPDIIIYIEGVDFHDSSPPPSLSYGKPKATHKAEGFLLIPSASVPAKALRPSELLSFIEQYIRDN